MIVTMATLSTSIHTISADRPLNWLTRASYKTLNWFNLQYPHCCIDPALEQRQFVCPDLDLFWNKVAKTASPSRKLSDLFWLSLPWQLIQQELGEINILDTGCGSGNYGARLQDWSNQRLVKYVGVDRAEHSNWQVLQQQYSHFQFFAAPANNFYRIVPDTINLFISQSAIEHFEQDILYFKQIRAYILQNKHRPVLQIHLFPSAACYHTYPYHGVRQYTPRTISKITRLFRDCSYAVLFGLGDRQCNQLHRQFILEPSQRRSEDWRNLYPDRYDKELLDAVRQDMRRSPQNPAFYALVIHSNGANKLF